MATRETAAYEPQAWEEVPCPFCGSTERRHYERFGWQLRFTYVECLGCGLIYQSPRPRYDQAFVETAYGDYVSIEAVTGASEEQVRRWMDGLAPVAREMAALDPRRTALLDVGSCMGLFLRVASPLWPKVAGVEISEKMRVHVERELGFPVFGEPFENLRTGDRFSCIQMSHVLEHVPDPSAWLRKAHELLADEGLLVIAIPHVRSLEHRAKHLLKRLGLRRSDWHRASKTPDHLFEPPIPVLRRFVEAHGFEIVSCYTYSRSDETSEKPFNRLFRRRLLLGSNTRLHARRVPGT
ncbi:MAG TPA: methyltransferase domain-containing protein [Anaeromyxobacteraceae bacterium]|nr:methyltransferase domain-containing protein [Anaeromyxobacteraceae bacterium]